MHGLFSKTRRRRSRSGEETVKPHKHWIDIFRQKSEKVKREPIYRKERTALTFSATSLWLLKWNLHRKKDYKSMYGRTKVLFFCSVQLLHVISTPGSIFVVIERMKRGWQPRSEIRAKTVKTRVLGWGRFPVNKNSGLKFRKFPVLNGTVHSGCTDPTQTTARFVIVARSTLIITL